MLQNLPNEDLVHISDAKIPAFLRIDKDVRNKREVLFDYYTQYQQFDINHLDEQVKNQMRQEIEAVSKDYKDHQE